MVLLLQYTLIFASVLTLVVLGGCFSEHSGVINIGLEGIMVMGALGGALMMKYLPSTMAAPLVILLVILGSVIVGMVFSLFLGVAAIHFNADQTLVGTVLNLLGPAAAVVIVRAINMSESIDNVSSTVAYKEAKKAFLVNIGKFESSWFMLLALLILIASYIILYKTRFGLRLMACGEHPQAADSVGINVYTGFDVLVALKLSSTLYNMFPYIISLIVLVFVSKNSRVPKAEGIPYDKEQR